MSETNIGLAEQFDDLDQQREASTVGIWAFLATEVIFFGGLFMAYIVYRSAYPHDFAVGSQHTIVLYGTINTAILLTSSLTMALAVHAAQMGDNKWVTRFLLITVFFGLCFLGVKGLEYTDDIREHLFPGPHFDAHGAPKSELFFYLYWAMTGLHALHVTIGVGILAVMAWLSSRNHFSAKWHNPVEVTGLYWHFVDIVWVFLYPLLYLISKHV